MELIIFWIEVFSVAFKRIINKVKIIELQWDGKDLEIMKSRMHFRICLHFNFFFHAICIRICKEIKHNNWICKPLSLNTLLFIYLFIIIMNKSNGIDLRHAHRKAHKRNQKNSFQSISQQLWSHGRHKIVIDRWQPHVDGDQKQQSINSLTRSFNNLYYKCNFTRSVRRQLNVWHYLCILDLYTSTTHSADTLHWKQHMLI